MRAYEDDLPFLVVGGDHLNPAADAYLPPAARHSAVVAELAHLRLAHSRVTPADVWAGGLELGVEGLRAMVAAHPARLAKWSLVRRHPLVDVLVHGDDPSECDQLFSVRVAAMLAFFVSTDYATLRQATRIVNAVPEI